MNRTNLAIKEEYVVETENEVDSQNLEIREIKKDVEPSKDAIKVKKRHSVFNMQKNYRYCSRSNWSDFTCSNYISSLDYKTMYA